MLFDIIIWYILFNWSNKVMDMLKLLKKFLVIVVGISFFFIIGIIVVEVIFIVFRNNE